MKKNTFVILLIYALIIFIGKGVANAEEQTQYQMQVQYQDTLAIDISHYITHYYRTVPPQFADIIAKTVLEKSKEHDIPYEVVLAVIEVESSFNPFAISNKGARGLMQVMYSVWGKELNLTSQYQLHDLEIGIDCGIQIIKKYLKQTKNDMRKTLYKYVGGDSKYGKRVYECMGKFVVFKNFRPEISIKTEEISSEKIESLTKPTTYVVKKGDTLGSIAKKLMGGSKYWHVILKYNPDLDVNKLQAGDEILIPIHLVK